MKRFGFKKILSHYRNSNDNKSVSEQPIETPFHSQDDNTEPTDNEVETLPTVKAAVEKTKSKLRPLEPTVRAQFVLGRSRERSRKPKLLRYLGGMCKLCPVCGQETIDTGLPPDGHNCICSTCNAKIQMALESFKDREETGQDSAPAPAPGPAPTSAPGPAPAMGANSSRDRSEPPPFSIVVLQDCENSALIDQLTNALARTCPQYNNNRGYNNHYNDMCENEYTENPPPPNPMPAYGYDQPHYNPNPGPSMNQVYYDETQNRIYDRPVNRRYSSRQHRWAAPENYNNYYPMQYNMAASSRTSLYTSDNPVYNYERQYSGTTLSPSARQCQCNGASNGAYNERPSRTRSEDQSYKDTDRLPRRPSEDQAYKDTGCQGYSCEHCRQVCESNKKLLMLITQTLELFIANRRSEKHPKGRKSKKGARESKTESQARNSPNSGVSVTKSDNTKEPRTTALKPKEKTSLKLNNQKFFVPVQEQTRHNSCPEGNCKATSCPSVCEAACSKLTMSSGASGASGAASSKQAKSGSDGGARGRRSRGSRNSKSPAGNKPTENAAQSCCCCPCARQPDRVGGGDALGRCCAARRLNGLQPVAHYRPGLLQFPVNYMLQRNGEWVRRSLVRTAAGATLHERPHSDPTLASDQNRCRQPANSCQGCRPNCKFCR